MSFSYPHDDHPPDIIERMVAASWKREGALQYIDVLAKGDPDLKFQMLVEYRRLSDLKLMRERESVLTPLVIEDEADFQRISEAILSDLEDES